MAKPETETAGLSAAREDVPDLLAEVRRLRAALVPILAAWDREVADCGCRQAATVLRREWMDAARAARDGTA